MSNADNTLLMRLTGPMQSWGTSSPLQLRRTDSYPSKSGVLGILLCAKGISREESRRELGELVQLTMGVRVDHRGTLDWDYHTAGAKIGIRKAEGGIKKTLSTGELETLLSRRQYLYDASFLVALHGPAETVGAYANALNNPVWPIFLGRKCCVPAEPVFAGTGSFDTVNDALSSVPWRPQIVRATQKGRASTQAVDTIVEYKDRAMPPPDARLVHDVPRVFGYLDYSCRWIITRRVTIPVAPAIQRPASPSRIRYVDYTSLQWKAARLSRLVRDHHLCVFCKSPAVDVHHVSYANVGRETDSDLRSLCKLCHDACTMLEYGDDLRTQRVDPSDPAQRQAILRQIHRLLTERRLGQRRELLEAAGASTEDLLADMAGSSQVGGQ